MSKRNTALQSNSKKEYTCPACQKKFWDYPSQHPICCSRTCAATHQSNTTLPERFWGRVKKTKKCWLWMGKRNPRGYGKIRVEKREYMAHKYSFEAFYSLVPNGLFVLHDCDNPSCVNPEHLFLGTITDNNSDMRNKLRHAFGEKHGGAKLSNEDVKKMKNLATSGVPRHDIVLAFKRKSTRQNTMRILRGERWSRIV